MNFEKPKQPEQAKETPAQMLDMEVEKLLNYTGNVEQKNADLGEELYGFAQDALNAVSDDTQKETAKLRYDMLHREASEK